LPENNKLLYFYKVEFLGTITELRKATISFVVFVRLFDRMEHISFHWMDSHEIW